MGTVGIKELKNRLTHYLRRTKQGEEMVVTERGQAIALLQPIRSARQVASLDAKLAQLAARGILALPQREPATKVRRVRIVGAPASRVILEDRR